MWARWPGPIAAAEQPMWWLAAVVGRQAPLVEHPAGGGTVRSAPSTKPASASDLPTARRRLWPAVSPRPAGAGGSTDGMTSRLSSRRTSSTRSAGCLMSGRQLGGVATRYFGSESACTRAPIWVRRPTVAPSGYATPAIRSGRSTPSDPAARSRPAADRLASRWSQFDCSHHDLGQQAGVQRSMAATETAGSTERRNAGRPHSPDAGGGWCAILQVDPAIAASSRTSVVSSSISVVPAPITPPIAATATSSTISTSAGSSVRSTSSRVVDGLPAQSEPRNHP